MVTSHALLPLLASGALACSSGTPRYIVTATPIDVGVGPEICVALAADDSDTVWWWQPGSSGCESRSTGPGIFRADARVSPGQGSSPTAVSMRIGTHSTLHPFTDVRLVLEGRELRAVQTGARVTTVLRKKLDIPERLP